LGYVLFKQKKYAEAATHFNAYLDKSNLEPARKNDAYLRLGDTYFVTSSYQNAIAAYEKSKQLEPKTADYAVFQTALSYGFIKNKTKKINLLNQVISTYRKSLYRDDALYVLASTYTGENQTNKALQAYDKLIGEHPKSILVRRALLKKGLIYYNNNDNEKALSVYKKAVSDYPNTAIAQEAVRNARQIYVDTGRVDEYAEWVKNLDFVNVSDAELDHDMYESADVQYTMNAYNKAIVGYRKYLQNFPNGLHVLQAHFYSAQCYEAIDKPDKTETHYRYIVEQPQSEYTEQALSRLSQVYLNHEDWDKAMPLLSSLETMADHQQNVIYAQSNLMKAYYNKENYTQAVVYAEKVLSQTGVEDKVKSDATIIIARSAIKTNDETKARTAYKQVENTGEGLLKAEALYYDAYFRNKEADYEGSNVVVQRIASEFSAYKYWGAKALVIMAQNFYALDDAYQATYILDSVIKNFKQFDDVVQEAQELLNSIKTEQAKTNDSVLPE